MAVSDFKQYFRNAPLSPLLAVPLPLSGIKLGEVYLLQTEWNRAKASLCSAYTGAFFLNRLEKLAFAKPL